MTAIVEREFARDLGERWRAAWSSGDLEEVFALYQTTSRCVRRSSTAVPPLRFELIDCCTLCVHYRSVGRKVVLEFAIS